MYSRAIELSPLKSYSGIEIFCSINCTCKGKSPLSQCLIATRNDLDRDVWGCIETTAIIIKFSTVVTFYLSQ